MDSVIKVDRVSKRYRLRHEAQTYRSLREEIMSGLKGAMRKPFARGHRHFSESNEDFWALKDVSFDVRQGERVGIIGRNGAGKSTLLKILSRITDPTSGRVEITGKVSSLLEVGTGFHPELSGRENIFLNGAILGMRAVEVRRKFDQIVAFAEVERFLDTPVKRYSSGMYVRLAFAVAAHLEPEVLVVDEVLAVGDAQFQQKCLGRMEELSHSGRTILFVTHNMDAMLALCNRGLVLDKGGLEYDGDPLTAREHYLSSVKEREYSVSHNTGRGGSGGVLIEGVEITEIDLETQDRKHGKSIRIQLRAEADENYKNRKDLDLAFGIDTIDGHRVFTTLSSWTDSQIDASTGIINACCDVECIPLVPGKYLVSASIIFRGDTLDSVQHCASFDVLVNPGAVHVERMKNWGVLELPCRFFNA